MKCNFTWKVNENKQTFCTLDKLHSGIHYDGYFTHPAVSVMNEQKEFGKITSTKLPRLELIPKSALESLARRFELGIERKGNGAWNALTLHLKGMSDDEFRLFAIERLSHVVHHCYDAILKLSNQVVINDEDDAGAILFGGAVLAEFRKRMEGK